MEKVLDRFGMRDANTSLTTHFKLSATLSPQADEEMKYMPHVPYSSAVGSIMYVMVYTHLNISQAVSVVSRYMFCPDNGHWPTMK